MEVKQIYLPQMENFAYLIGDEASRTCAIIDPAFDPQKILNTANTTGFTITHVINTHGHSDHTSGNAAIIEATDAQLCIHRADADQVTRLLTRAISRFLGGKGSPPPSRLLEDNDIINIGQTDLRVIHTPGHTPGSICIYATAMSLPETPCLSAQWDGPTFPAVQRANSWLPSMKKSTPCLTTPLSGRVMITAKSPPPRFYLKNRQIRLLKNCIHNFYKKLLAQFKSKELKGISHA